MATATIAALTALRDALAGIDGVETCRVGLEPDISPDDYPLIRIVPSKKDTHTRAVGGRQAVARVDVLVYFGAAIEVQDGDGMLGVYARLFEIEQAILAVLESPPEGILAAQYVETLTDEDAIQTYKMMAVRASVVFSV